MRLFVLFLASSSKSRPFVDENEIYPDTQEAAGYEPGWNPWDCNEDMDECDRYTSTTTFSKASTASTTTFYNTTDSEKITTNAPFPPVTPEIVLKSVTQNPTTENVSNELCNSIFKFKL